MNSNIFTDTFVLHDRCLQNCYARICIIVPTLVASHVCVWDSSILQIPQRYCKVLPQGTVAGTSELASESCIPALPVSHTDMTALDFIIHETVAPQHTSTHPPANMDQYKQINPRTHTHKHTHRHTHGPAHAQTSTHTHTHTHYQQCFSICSFLTNHTILYLLNFT